MPLVTIKLIEGVFNDDEKQQMINHVTDAMLSIEGEESGQIDRRVTQGKLGYVNCDDGHTDRKGDRPATILFTSNTLSTIQHPDHDLAIWLR